MKRVKYLLLALFAIGITLLVAVAAGAEDEPVYFVSSDSMWRCQLLDDNTVSVDSGVFDFAAYLGNETNVTVPSVIDSYPVTQVDKYAFSFCENIESVTFSEGIKILKTGVFYNCETVKRIVLPESLELIEENALPDSDGVSYVATVGSYAEGYLLGMGCNVVSVESGTKEIIKGWRTVDGKKYYFNSEGKMLKGFQKIKRGDGKLYYHYFGNDGAMRTGFQKIKRGDGKLYYHYFGDNGCMRLGFQKIKRGDGKTYYHYFGDNGCMRLGFQKIKRGDGKTYYHYFGDNGCMRTAWQKIKRGDGKIYLHNFGTNGCMCTGWKKIKMSDGVTRTYYFKSNGVMATGKTLINGKTQYFTKNGTYVNPDSPLLRKVYIYSTGKRYHYKKSCSGANCIEVTLLEAKEMGLTPCKSCAGG